MMSEGEWVFLGFQVWGGGGVEVFRIVSKGGEGRGGEMRGNEGRGGEFFSFPPEGVWILSGVTHYKVITLIVILCYSMQASRIKLEVEIAERRRERGTSEQIPMR